jgi:hypothetical protein
VTCAFTKVTTLVFVLWCRLSIAVYSRSDRLPANQRLAKLYEEAVRSYQACMCRIAALRSCCWNWSLATSSSRPPRPVSPANPNRKTKGARSRQKTAIVAIPECAPTTAELGFPYVEASIWYGLFASRGTAAPIVAQNPHEGRPKGLSKMNPHCSGAQRHHAVRQAIR